MDKLRGTVENMRDKSELLDSDKQNLMFLLLSNDDVLSLLRKLMFEGYKISKDIDPEEQEKLNKFKTEFAKSRNKIL